MPLARKLILSTAVLLVPIVVFVAVPEHKGALSIGSFDHSPTHAHSATARSKEMRFFGNTKFRKWTMTIWFVVLIAASAVLGVAMYGSAHLQPTDIAALLSGIFVSILLGRYELRIPGTTLEISVGGVIALWGVLWLGVSGGVVLGAAASVAVLVRHRRFDVSGVYEAASKIISIAASAFAFIFAFDQDLTITRSAGFDDAILTFGTSCFMAVTALAIFSIFDLIFKRSEGELPTGFAKRTLFRSIEVLPVITGAVALSLLFSYFGIAFGLVVVPVTVLAVMAYSMHLKRLEQKTSQILEASRIHLATVEALATAIDARDQIGNGHVRRTQIYAVGLGEAMGLPESDINALRLGALLHDIGKLAVPDHILSKPGPLTHAEIEKTKNHSSVGAAILETVGFQYPVVPTVKYHHECWDGSGYPEGLSGDAIPQTARILAIADSYDTLRSARPFRPAISREKARDQMRTASGSQFDPKIVRIFIERLAGLESQIESNGLSYSNELIDVRSMLNEPGNGYVEQIKLANKEIFTLYELAREFGSSANLSDMLALFTGKIKELVPFDTCSVYLLDGTKRYANAVHVEGDNSELLSSRRIKVGEGATGVALKKRQLVKNVNPDLDFSLSHLEMIQQYLTMASLPLMADDELIGAVSIYSNQIETYGEEHLRLLETISRIAGDAIGKSQQYAQAQTHALTDPMTGLANARSLQVQFEKEVGRAGRAGSSFQVLVLDLDGFKAVNDNFGHKVGDEMLREVGQVIKGQLRDYDFLSRYGGDEFVALVPETDQKDVIELCSRIESAVAEFRLPVENGQFASVGVSLGSAGYPANGTTFDQMIVAADKAMYLSKSSRKRKKAFARKSPTAPMAEMLEHPFPHRPDLLDRPSNEGFIVELDESHVITSAAIN